MQNENLVIMKNDSLALGFFDGIHKGHAEVLRYTKSFAEHNGGHFYATTFADEISDFTSKSNKFLTPLDRRIANLKSFGAIPVTLPSDSAFFEMSPQEFIRYLIEKFSPSCVVCGENFRFGKNRSGNVEVLECELKDYGIEFKTFPLYKTESGETVSTTFIKNLIKNNDFAAAEQLMVYPYTVGGITKRCTQTGSAMGFPTANIIPNPIQFLPDLGVYAGIVETEDGVKKSIINVGCRPTFGDDTTKIECHYIEDNSGKEYYGQKITVRFVAKIRDIIKFNSSVELAEQLNKDKETAKCYLRGEK